MTNVIAAIRAGDLQLPLPQTLSLHDGEQLHCERLLRLLPGKRGVFKARYREQTVLAKIFLDSASRQIARERAGYERLIAAQQPTPPLLATANFDGGTVLLFEFLSEARPLFREDMTPSAHELKTLLDRVQAMYANGVYHDDLHWGNFLYCGDTAFVIDAGAILGEPPQPLSATRIVDNLGLLIAQFRRCDHALVQATVLSHAVCEQFQLTAADIAQPTEQHWRRRKQLLLNKCFRDTTAHAFVSHFDRTYAFRREYAGADLDAFLRTPDSAMARGQALKLGNSATVVKLRLDNRDVVIKRYNMKGLWHWLRRCLRPSRAWASWRNAHWIQLLGLHTPAPLAFLEMRCGLLRRRAYYVCEYIHGDLFTDILQQREPNAAELAELEKYFTLAAREQLVHGDMKATNFLVHDEKLAILDLDAMREIENIQRWRKTFRRDFARFERNISDSTAAWLASLQKLVAKLAGNLS